VADIKIEHNEFELLLRYKAKSTNQIIRARADTVLLASEEVPISTIARVTDRKESTIKAWLRQWRKTRMASIMCGYENNMNASKLTLDQRNEVTAILQSPPSPEGIPIQFWDVPTLAGIIQTKFGVEYASPGSYRFLLHLAGLSFHLPEKLDRRRDDRAVEERMAQIRAEIKPLLVDPGWIVYAADEVRIDQEAETRRAWYKRGSKTVMKVDRQRQAQSYFGLLDQNNGKCLLERVEWQTGEQVLDALERLIALSRDKKICVVWDNAAWHKSKPIREALQKGGSLENVHLIAMPPYAPDHNPIEHVWNWAKTRTANIQQENFDDTLTKFETTVKSRRFHYQFIQPET